MNRDEISYFEAETDPDQSRTRGILWAKSLRLKSKVENHIGGGGGGGGWGVERPDFLLGKKIVESREIGKEKKEIQTSLFNLRSSIDRNSSSQEQKFIYSTRATRGYRKHGILPRIQARSSGNQKFGV